ncbi:hypothetical protein KDW_41490 [Dictyobacter vulcani]|uniref:Uncharacterized protein n=1 Tax=Dictyobacter vulcani TaxID=2607529 RepID=A0A5J4KU77_9CHLR|nr:hypothetical protein [Dictyobacter vulcani]GER89987.1 hypothetical protein KDW_41490 [Dictyobacter vulcani]
MTHQADLLRKRSRYETSFRRFVMAQPWAMKASPFVRGTWYKVQARAYSVYGDEQSFLRNINEAQNIVENTPRTLDTLSNQFDLVEVLQEKAQGHTILWQPLKALDIYAVTDTLRPFRPLRDMGSCTIVKAQAYTYAGETDEGVKYAIRGLEMAQQYQSKRHISRIQGMYDRLSVTPLGRSAKMKELHTALIEK